MVTRIDVECKRCGTVVENVWKEAKHRGHIYCPVCYQKEELTKSQARL